MLNLLTCQSLYFFERWYSKNPKPMITIEGKFPNTIVFQIVPIMGKPVLLGPIVKILGK